ncbi:MAG TPA: hypothetical protein VJY33_07790, partial [Isosphaeraceae bacterium]|nr:hypothetical protein [Isosphaeraceae bacterium]
RTGRGSRRAGVAGAGAGQGTRKVESHSDFSQLRKREMPIHEGQPIDPLQRYEKSGKRGAA